MFPPRLSLEMPKEEVPRFLRMLFTMVSDTACERVIRWAHEGAAFEIVDAECLCSDVLSVYYTTQKFSSFQRQLNYFGFRKWTKTQTDVCTFSHPDFLQHDQDRLSQIRRGKQTASSLSYSTSRTIGSPMSWSQVAKPTPTKMNWAQVETPKLSVTMRGNYNNIPQLNTTTKETARNSTVGFKRSLGYTFAASVEPKKMCKSETEMTPPDINFVNAYLESITNDIQFNDLIDSLSPVTGDFRTLFDKESSSFPIENNDTNWMDVLLQEKKGDETQK